MRNKPSWSMVLLCSFDSGRAGLTQMGANARVYVQWSRRARADALSATSIQPVEQLTFSLTPVEILYSVFIDDGKWKMENAIQLSMYRVCFVFFALH